MPFMNHKTMIRAKCHSCTINENLSMTDLFPPSLSLGSMRANQHRKQKTHQNTSQSAAVHVSRVPSVPTAAAHVSDVEQDGFLQDVVPLPFLRIIAGSFFRSTVVEACALQVRSDSPRQRQKT